MNGIKDKLLAWLVRQITTALVVLACINYVSCALSGTNETQNAPSPPYNWTEHWFEHNVQVSLVYSDDYVSFYFDQEVNQTLEWPFKNVSGMWRHIRLNYNIFPEEDQNEVNSTKGPTADQRLYVILHEGKFTGLHTAPYTSATHDRRNVIDCGQTISTEDANVVEKCSMDSLFEGIVQVLWGVISGSKQAQGWPNEIYTNWRFYRLLQYDIFKATQSKEITDNFKATEVRKSTEFLTYEFYDMRDWYIPIYEKYGGIHVIQNFIERIKFYTKLHGRFEDKTVNAGSFAHLWSEAVGVDLRDLAYKTYRWTPEYQKKFEKARTKYSHYNYTDTFLNPNTSSFNPPSQWTEKWEDHRSNLTLVYSDAHVAFYYDSFVPKTVTWPFEPLSQAWQYAKGTFGSFGPDPLLHIILHNKAKTEESLASNSNNYWDNNYDHKRTIDCSKIEYDGWNLETTENLNTIMTQLATIIIRVAKETGNWPSYTVSRWSMRDILVYDIYRGIGRHNESEEWANEALQHVEKQPAENAHWFRDWFYPIYSQHGETEMLNQYFTNVVKHWPKKGNNYNEDFTLNEFTHFWSGTVDTDLRSRAYSAFGWSTKYEAEFKTVQKKYPQFNYTETFQPPEPWALDLNVQKLNLTCVYNDAHVSFYYDTEIEAYSITWPFNPLSHAWDFAKENYTLFEKTSPKLYVILRATNEDEIEGCTTSKSKSFLDPSFDDRLVISCTLNSSHSNIKTWETLTPKNLDMLMDSVMIVILSTCNETGNYPAMEVSGWEMGDILVYDIYNNMDRTADASRWKANQKDHKIDQPRKNTYWFRNWFLPIYRKYGRGAIISKFFKLLSNYWPKGPNGADFSGQLNIGEFVHFWSEAAGENLVQFANETFGWSDKDALELIGARKRFPEFIYKSEGEPPTQPNDQKQTLTIAMALGAVVFILFAILLVFYQRKFRMLKEQIRKLTNDEIDEFFEGQKAGAGIPGEGKFNAKIESEPFNKEYEIGTNQLEINNEKILGSGEYGVVLEGLLKIQKEKGIDGFEDRMVAVKTPKPNVDVITFKSLLTELKVMAHLGKHDSIAALLGAVTANIRNRELYVALEYCSNGDLLEHLKKNRNNFQDLFSTTNGTPQIQRELNGENEMTTLDLLNWALQISNGMDYISSKKVIHGDLAARNVLITGANVAKISDFGLSRQLANYSNYMKTTKTPLPWRWMSIEALRDMEFSVHSDIWAYGVVLHEIFSLGLSPYPGFNWTLEFINQLEAGLRLKQPQHGNDDIYSIMMSCMLQEPTARIRFAGISLNLEDIKRKLKFRQANGSEIVPGVPKANSNGGVDYIQLTMDHL